MTGHVVHGAVSLGRVLAEAGSDPASVVGLTADRFGVLVVLGCLLLAGVVALLVMGFGR